MDAATLVLGIGNLLMGDEGVGVHAIRALEQEAWPPHVALLDGGTGGFHLLESLQAHPHVVMIDATMDGQPAGTVSVLRPKYASDFPRALTAHDIGLRDLMESAALVGGWPDITLVTVSIDAVVPMVMTLSPPVAAALTEVARLVRAQVDAGVSAHA
ncbi:MAG TPA: hydrogenase maturation protease [Vicinamibacterales bacterium]|nr:hydrogenase maturation protease [Vicinamibacterales bacterium]